MYITYTYVRTLENHPTAEVGTRLEKEGTLLAVNTGRGLSRKKTEGDIAVMIR